MRFKIISQDSLPYYQKMKHVIIIDLRSQQAYEDGHIPGAVWMDWETIEDTLQDTLNDSFSELLPLNWLILYCDYGNISLITARDLARIGYPVISLNGGLNQWNGALEKRLNSSS